METAGKIIAQREIFPATFDSQKVTTSSGTQMISNELNIYRLAIQSL